MKTLTLTIPDDAEIKIHSARADGMNDRRRLIQTIYTVSKHQEVNVYLKLDFYMDEFDAINFSPSPHPERLFSVEGHVLQTDKPLNLEYGSDWHINTDEVSGIFKMRDWKTLASQGRVTIKKEHLKCPLMS